MFTTLQNEHFQTSFKTQAAWYESKDQDYPRWRQSSGQSLNDINTFYYQIEQRVMCRENHWYV